MVWFNNHLDWIVATSIILFNGMDLGPVAFFRRLLGSHRELENGGPVIFLSDLFGKRSCGVFFVGKELDHPNYFGKEQRMRCVS